MSGEAYVDGYIRGNIRRYRYLALFMMITAAIALYSFGIGSKVISFSDVWQVISDRISGNIPVRSEGYWPWLKDELIFNGTMPRSIGAVLVGAVLGICGAVMQACVRNPLAEPYTTGISSAALFGATISLALGIELIPGEGDIGTISNAFVFSLIPCAATILLSIRRKTTATQMVLIGIGIMYLFSAFTMMIKYNAEPDILDQIYEWSIGSVSRITWTGVEYLAVALIALTVSMMYFSSDLDILSLGDGQAHSLGVDPGRTRMACMVIVSLCTAVAVCFSGSIGFIGLVIPHLSRLFVGSKMKVLIPCSAILGALFLVGADVISRSLSTGIPTGAVVALIGAPVFLYFLIKIRTNGWGH